MLYCLKLTEYPQNDAIFEARDTGLAKPISFGVPTCAYNIRPRCIHFQRCTEIRHSTGFQVLESNFSLQDFPRSQNTWDLLKTMSSQKGNDRLPNIRFQVLLLMDEILHQLISSLSHYVQGFYTSQVVSRISSINSMLVYRRVLGFNFNTFDPAGKLLHEKSPFQVTSFGDVPLTRIAKKNTDISHPDRQHS